ncbi:MAG: hypothetical protein IT384_14710 [Deltaproteobacteria bacterium]|nr:hypothetical protein [Deltaproteobacteria bacterium]
MHHRSWLSLTLLTFAALPPGLASAQIGADQALGAASDLRAKLKPPSIGGEVMFGKIGEDVFARTLLRFNYDAENWGIGLGIPLSIRLVDNDPKNGKLLRIEDWDEPSDFFRLVRYVYVGDPSKTGPFYIRLGELAGLSMGHGTVIHRYYNGFDLNRYRLGTNVALNVGAFGVDAVIGDLVRPTDPTVVGFRFQVKPLMLVDLGESAPASTGAASPDAPPGEGAPTPAPAPSETQEGDGLYGAIADRLHVGFTLLVDPTAPLELRTSGAQVLLDDQENPQIARERALVVTGVDVGYDLLRGLIRVTPYIDLNKITYVDSGWGFHAGVLWGLRIPAVIDTFTVDLRTEYRRVSGDYVSPYFNSTYEVERFEAPPGSRTPKLGSLVAQAGQPGKNGAVFDLVLGFPSFAYIGGEYINYDSAIPDGSIRLSLEVPALEVVELSAFYYRINIDGFSDMFALDDRSAIVAEARIPLYTFFSLNLRWWRVWRPEQTGSYEAVDDWSVGFGFSFPL